MADSLPPVVGRLIGDNADYVNKLHQAESATKDSTDRSSGHFSKLGGAIKGVAGILGGVGIAFGTASFLKGIWTESEEARRTLVQTQAVIASTGGVAGVSAKDVDNLSNRLSALTGIDDEAIAANENLLLTFTNVRNGVGKGNDIFNQATKATLDMSVALGQDGKTSAIQLGKALNDPIKGVTALQRVGVSFTAQQKEQIKTLVESGKTLDAQKIILKEINTEFGGSAAAAASPMARLTVAFKNLQEQVGTALMPVLATVATFLADRLPGAISAVGQVIGPLIGGVRAFVAAFKAGGDDITSSGFAGKMEAVGLKLRAAFDLVQQAVRAFVASFRAADGDITSSGFNGTMERIGFVVREVVDFVVTNFPRVRDTIATVISGIVSFVQGNFIPVLAGVGAIVALVVVPAFIAWAVATASAAAATIVAAAPFIALAALVGALAFAVVYAYEHFQIFRDIVDGVASFLVSVVSAAFDEIALVIRSVIDIVTGIIELGLDLIRGDWGAAWDDIKGILSAAWDLIVGTIRNEFRVVNDLFAGLPGDILDALGDLGGLLWDAGADLVRGLIGGIGHMARAAANAALDVVRGAVDAAKHFLGIGSPSKLFHGFGLNIAQGLVDGLGAGEDMVGRAGAGLAAATAGGIGDIAGGTAVGGTGGVGRGGVTINIHTATGDIPDSTLRKIRSQLFELGNDVPPGQIIPAA